MKCVVHIGTEKTGTTLIQRWLYANQLSLSQQGVYLSELLGKNNNRLFASYFQSQLDSWTQRNNISTMEEKETYFEGFLDHLSTEIDDASKSHDVFVITSEHLHSRVTERKDIEDLSRFLRSKFDEVKILCYFRHQFDMAVSLYSTALKNSLDAGIENFISSINPQSYYYNFQAIADNWCGVFGRDDCIFRIYDREQFPLEDIRRDFLYHVLPIVDESQLDFEVQSANESLSQLEAVAYRSINRHVQFWDEMEGGISEQNQRLKMKVSSLAALKRGSIVSDARGQITELFAAANREFLTKYFDESVTLPSNKVNDANADSFSIEEVEQIVVDIFDALLPEVTGSSQFGDDDAVTLRDIALRVESGDAGIADSLAIMQLAKRLRPTGPLILEKINHYRERLEADS